jgi:ligand-binding sensor domain-containing protein
VDEKDIFNFIIHHKDSLIFLPLTAANRHLQPHNENLQICFADYNMVDHGAAFCTNGISSFSPPDGGRRLTDGNIRCIAQDDYGFMWFGTGSGLNRYDGYSIKSYQKKIRDSNSLSDDVINDLLVANDNKLWIATAGGLNVYDLVTDTFTHSFHKENDPQSLPSNDVRRLAEDAQGNVWIATEGRITRYAPATNQYTHYPPLNEPPLTDIIDIVLDNKDQLWVTSGSWGGTAGNGLYIIKSGSSIEKVSLPAVYKSKPVSHSLFGIAFDPSGYIWCSSFSGCFLKFTRILMLQKCLTI